MTVGKKGNSNIESTRMFRTLENQNKMSNYRI